MKKSSTSALALASKSEMTTAVAGAWEAVGMSFERFCLIAGMASLTQMLEEDTQQLAGTPHARDADKPGYRRGHTRGRVGFHGGKVEMERPRVRSKTTGKELPLPSWQEAAEAGLLEEWAMSLMGMNVATRKVGCPRSAGRCGCPRPTCRPRRDRGSRNLRFPEGSRRRGDRGAAGRVDGVGSVASRPLGDPDRRASHG